MGSAAEAGPQPSVARNQLERTAAGARGDHQILGGAAETGPQMMIVGIDHRGAPRKIGFDVDPGRPEPESPRLRVVTVGRERRIANQVGKLRLGLERGAHSGRRLAK